MAKNTPKSRKPKTPAPVPTAPEADAPFVPSEPVVLPGGADDARAAEMLEAAKRLAGHELVKPPAGQVAGFARPGTIGFTEAHTMHEGPPPGMVAGYATPGIDGFAH